MSIDWPLTWTTVYALATVGMLFVLGATASWARGQVDEARRSRQLVCLTTLSERWDSQLMREARRIVNLARTNFDDTLKNMDTENSDDYFKVVALASFFEDLGILEKERQVTFGQVVERFGPSITYYHSIFKNFIAEQQKEDPSILMHFDNLANRLAEQRLQTATS